MLIRTVTARRVPPRTLCPRFVTAVLVLGLVLANTAGAAESDAGPQLLRECEAAQSMRLAMIEGTKQREADALNAGLCLGLLQALSELNELVPKPLFCPPSGTLLGEAVRVVVDHLRRPLDRAEDSRTAAALAALRAAYPCPR
jgi:hypothetical protein